MPTTPGTISLPDITGNPQPIKCETDGSGNKALHSVPEIGGNAVASNNPMPVALFDAAGNEAVLDPAGQLSVLMPPTLVFYDGFEAAFDTTNRWNAASIFGTAGAGLTNSVGSVQLSTGAAATSGVSVQSQPSFCPPSPGYLHTKFIITLPASIPANTYAWFGHATLPGTPTALAPVTYGIGFEFAVGGVLSAVTYQNGTRNTIAALTVPTDGAQHSYGITRRADKYWFSMDGVVVAIGTGFAKTPAIETLPVALSVIAGASAPGSSLVLNCQLVTVADIGRNAQQIADGTYPWRKGTVTAQGGVATSPIAAAGASTGVAVTTTSAVVIAAGVAKQVCRVFNCSKTTIIWVSAGGTAVVGGSSSGRGSEAITPLGTWTPGAGQFVPSDAISLISESGTVNATVWGW